MIYVYKYEIYKEKEIYNFIDGLFSVNEEISFEGIVNKVRKLISKIKGYSYASKRKFLLYFITSVMAFTSVDNIVKALHDTKDQVAIEVVDQKFNLKDPLQLTISDNGKIHIKEEEKLRLSAYTIGDKMITVGWGHAERINKSKFKKGQNISRELAQSLFDKDIRTAEDGVKRIFSYWKGKGIDRKITQSQFDALVSMAFNMGVSNLWKSDVIKHIKSGDYKQAGEEIKYTNVDSKFPGLEKRRMKESMMFLSYLGNINHSSKA